MFVQKISPDSTFLCQIQGGFHPVCSKKHRSCHRTCHRTCLCPFPSEFVSLWPAGPGCRAAAVQFSPFILSYAAYRLQGGSRDAARQEQRSLSETASFLAQHWRCSMKFDPASQFFVIDSDNRHNVETHLYGYALSENTIIQNKELAGFDFDLDKVYAGSYVYVRRDASSIVIKQDFTGCYGVYLYRDKDYFAISNSFYMLLEHLKASRSLTPDYDFASAFIAEDLCSIAYSDTPVREIKMLPRNARLKISLTDGSIEIQHLDYEENTIEIESTKALEMLDTWFYKWTSIIRTIKAETDYISADLSGGFDSRTVFGLLSAANIDLNAIRINSAADTLHTHKEDYEIASQIAESCHFSLNGGALRKRRFTRFDSMEDTLNISFYTKLGFHKQMYFKYTCGTDPVFSFTGSGGECIRSYWNKTESEYREMLISRASQYSDFLSGYVSRELDSTFGQIKEKFGIAQDQENDYLLRHLYRETRCRNHFGKAIVESYMSNTITMTPLLDYELNKIKLSSERCQDKNLLIALIFVRYFPRLLDFRFEGGRSIDSATIAEARRLNDLVPFSNRNMELDTVPAQALPAAETEPAATKQEAAPQQAYSSQDVHDCLMSVFFSHKFRHVFCQSFPDHVYELMANKIKRASYFPLSETYVAIALAKYINDTSLGRSNAQGIVATLDALSRSHVPAESDDAPDIEGILKYSTARADLKICGSANNRIVVLENRNGSASQPKWFCDSQGQGTVVTSGKTAMSLKIRCAGSGQLRTDLRGIDFRLKDNTRFPIWICYTKFSVNGVPVLKEPVCVCHDMPYTHSQKVSDGEELVLDLEWKALDSSCIMPAASHTGDADRMAASQCRPSGFTGHLRSVRTKIARMLKF